MGNNTRSACVGSGPSAARHTGCRGGRFMTKTATHSSKRRRRHKVRNGNKVRKSSGLGKCALPVPHAPNDPPAISEATSVERWAAIAIQPSATPRQNDRRVVAMSKTRSSLAAATNRRMDQTSDNAIGVAPTRGTFGPCQECRSGQPHACGLSTEHLAGRSLDVASTAGTYAEVAAR